MTKPSDPISGNNLSDDLEQTGIDLWNKAANMPEGSEQQKFLDASIAVQAVVTGPPASDAALREALEDLRWIVDGITEKLGDHYIKYSQEGGGGARDIPGHIAKRLAPYMRWRLG